MNIIIPVQSHEDAKQLQAAGGVIGRLGCGNVWVLLSPAVTVTEDSLRATTAAIDKDIADLRKGEDAAIKVRDYKTAEEYKGKIDALLMNRSVEVRNAWKRVGENERKAEGAKYAQAFLKAANPENVQKPGWRVSLSAEHHPHENWITLLNEHSGKATWHEGMKPGEFCVMWPGQILEMRAGLWTEVTLGAVATKAGVVEIATEKPAPAKVPVPPLEFNAENRRKELESFAPSKITAIARRQGIKTKDRSVDDVVGDIVAAESAKAVAAL